MGYNQIVLRLCLAAFIGGCIGAERQIKNHPVGLRTNTLVCIAAAMVMILSQLMTEQSWRQYSVVSDPRLAGQVITGIGFLGAGTILRSPSGVRGLTTAASLWSVACIGLAVGAGYYRLALTASALVLIALVAAKYISAFLGRMSRVHHVKVELWADMRTTMELLENLEKAGVDINESQVKMSYDGGENTSSIDFVTRGAKQSRRVARALKRCRQVKSVEYNA